MNVGVARNFVGVVFPVLRDGATGSQNHRGRCCCETHICSTSISESLYLLSFSLVLTDVLKSRGVVMSMRRQGFVLLVL